MIRRIALFVLPLVLAAALAPAPVRAAGGLRWRSLDEGLREAKASGRPIMVDVFTDWCRWCKVMDRDVYSRADVQDYVARHFVPVRLNAESGRPATYAGAPLTERAVATRFAINSYPTTAFLRTDGSHVVNVPGYWPPDKFLLVLRFVAEGRFERGEDFDAFMSRAGAAR